MTMKLIDGGLGVPEEPDWTSIFRGRSQAVANDRRRAAEYWHNAITELRGADKLALSNGHAIQRLVFAYVLWDRAAAEVARQGAIIPAPKTKTPMHNPWTTAMTIAAKMASAVETELTLTPRHRGSGGKVPRRKATPSAAARYLRSVDNDGIKGND
jgi:P27 family predicted phage terminase small subunit